MDIQNNKEKCCDEYKFIKANEDKYDVDLHNWNNNESTVETKKSVESPSKVSRLCKNIFSIILESDYSGETNATSGETFISKLDENPNMLFSQAIKISIMIVDSTNSHKKINDKKPEIIYSIMLNVDNSIKSHNAVKSSLDLFNNLFEEKKEDFRLALNSLNYKLRPSKKNG